MNYFWLYLWTRLDSINMLLATCVFLGIWGVGGLIISKLMHLYDTESNKNYEPTPFWKVLNRWTSISIRVFILSCVLLLLIPSKRDVVLIWAVPTLVETDFVKDTGDILNKLPSVIRKEIEKYLEDEETTTKSESIDATKSATI